MAPPDPTDRETARAPDGARHAIARRLVGAKEAAPVKDPTLPTPPVDAAPARPRVLLVEDDEDMRDLLSTLLRQAGYAGYEGPDGMSLLKSLSSAAEDRPLFDAIVSDVQMPDFSAIEVLAALRMRDVRTPVVLISAFVDPAVRAEAADLGAVAF